MIDLIIIGGDNYNTLGCVRCFGYKKVPFRLILISKKKRSVVGASKFVNEYYNLKTETEAIELLNSMKEQWRGSVVIPTSDSIVTLLDVHTRELYPHYRYPHCGKPGQIEYLMDKAVQMELANKAGLRVPATVKYRRGAEMPKNLPYPCIIKQENSTEGQKKVMHVCQSEVDITQAIKANEKTMDFLIQQYVGKTHELLLLGCRLSDGETWIPAVFKKLRWMMSGGDGSYGIISTDVKRHFAGVEKVVRLIEAMDYYGPFSVEFGVEGNEAYFYEVNMRNDGTSHYFHAANVFAPYVYYLSCRNELNQKDLQVNQMEYTFIDEIGDLMNVPKRIRLGKWLKELHEAHAYKYYNKGDKRPFFMVAPKSLAWVLYKRIKGKK